jgi:TP901 family phage tail tape measure protein
MNPSEIKEIILKVNGEQAEQEIKRIKDAIEGARAEKKKFETEHPKSSEWSAEERKQWQAYNKEIAACERQLKKYGTSAETVEQILKDLDGSTMKQLKASLKTLNGILDSGKLERNGDEWKKVTEAIRLTKEEMKKLEEETKVVEKAMVECTEKPKRSFLDLGKSFGGFITTSKTILNFLDSFSDKVAGYVSQYAAMQKHVAGVSKYTGMAAKDVEELNEEFKKMDTKTSREALNDLAADAGRLGITAKKDVLDFVQAADQINIALGEDLGEGAVKNIGKLANIFGDDKRLGLKQAMLSTASAINELAQTSSASEGNILDFTTRLSSMAKTANMTQAQVMGLGAMFETQGLNAEVAATAISKVMQKMGTDTAKMAQLAGLNVQEFGNLVKTDMNAALIEFAKGIGRLGGLTEVSPVLKELSLTGAGVSSVVNILAQNLENVATQQDIATRAFTEGTSATNEAAKANSTAAANLEKAKNRARELQQTMGEQLYPIYLKCIEGSAKLSGVLASLAKFIGNNKAEFFILAGTIALLTINMKLANKETKIAMTLKRGWQAVVVSCRMAAMLFNAALALMTGNTTRAAAAMKFLNNTIKANPYTAIAALIVTIASGLLVWATRTKELTKAEKLRAAEQEAEMEVTKKALEQTKDEEAQIRKLTARIHSNVFSVKERREAIEELKKIIPDYNAEISEEGRITKENTEAVDDYIKKLREKAIVQAGEGALSGLYQQQIELEQKLADAQLKAKDAEVAFREARKKEGASQSAIDILANDLKKYPKYSLYGFTKDIKKFGGELRDASAEANELAAELEQTNKKIERTEEIINKKKPKEKPAPKKKPEPPAPTPDPVTPTNTPAPTTPDRLADNAAAMKQALQEISDQYAKGQLQAEGGVSAYATMLAKQLGIIEEYRKASKLIEATDEQRAKHGETLSKEEAAVKQKQLQDDLLQLTAYKDAELALADNARATGNTSQRQYEQEAYNIQAKYLQDKLLLLRSYNADAEQIHAAELEIEKHAASRNAKVSKELADTIAKMKAAAMKADPAAARKAAEEEIDALKDALVKEAREKRLGDETIKQLEEYLDKKKNDLTVNAKVKLDIQELDANKDFGFSKLIKAIKKFNKKAEGEMEDSWENIADTVVAALGMITSTLSAASQLFQANCDLETAKVEQEYDRRIAAAEGNDALQQQLEQQKQQRLSEIKAKYAEKEFKAKIAIAIADTAQNAIIAYGTMAKVQPHPLMSILAASMATAAGMVQIAVIKKQYEAQKAAGFFDGGYTGGTDWRKPAGIVHEGEYVLPHEALANPAFTPLLNIVEAARRSNRLASLTPEDVSRAVTAPQAAAAMAGRTAAAALSTASNTARTASNTTAPVVTIKGGDDTAAAVRRLNRKLDEGIESYVVLSGPQGLDKQWKRYQRLTGK